MEQRVVFHVDFDYFYAQCEELRNPELKTKPVVVCVFSDRGGDSGAIATANYVARKYGIKSGMPIRFAKKRVEQVPEAVFLPTDFDYYADISEKAMDVISKYADIFEYVGKDEAYLDVSKRTEGSFVSAGHLAQQLKNAVRNSTKLSCTVGIGKKTEEIFAQMDLKTISDLKKLDVFTLNSKFGRKIGAYIYNAARGIDDDPVSQRQEATQYSRITTLKQDSIDYDFLAKDLERLCEDVHATILKDNVVFKSVGIQFVQSDLSTKTKSKMLKNSTSSLDELRKTSLQLLHESLEGQKMPVRRLGVKVSELSQVSGQDSITRYF